MIGGCFCEHNISQAVLWLGQITTPPAKAVDSTSLDTNTGQAIHSSVPCVPSTQLDRVTVMSTRQNQSTVTLFFLVMQSSKPHHALRASYASHDRGVMMGSEAPVGTREQPCRCHLPNPSPGCHVIGWS